MPAYVGTTLPPQRSVDTDVKPKRLILSHKGFDSRSGGCPSPIFPRRHDVLAAHPVLGPGNVR